MTAIIPDQVRKLDTRTAERLADLLGLPAELFLGTPDETTDERLAREDAAADILSVDPLLAVRARNLAAAVGALGRRADVVAFPVGRRPLNRAALKKAA